MKKKAAQLRDDMRGELFIAHACRDFWWRSVGVNERRDQILQAFNAHLGYFGVSIPLFFRCYVIILMTLFDPDKRSITFRELLRALQGVPEPIGKPFDEIERDIEAAELIARKLNKIRNKHLAHRSQEIFDRNFYMETGLSHNDVKDLWDGCWAIFEALSYHVDRSLEEPLQDNVYAFDRLIDSLVPKNT